MASIKEEHREKGTVYVVRVRLPGGGTKTKVFDGRTVNEKTKKVSYNQATALKAAQQWATTMEADKIRQRLPADLRSGSTQFQAYAAGWMAKRRLRFRTRETYEQLLTRFIEPTFGKAMLSRITPDAVRSWHADLLAADDRAGRSHNQTAKAYALLRTILNTAVNDDILARNPCRIQGAGTIETAERPLVEPADVFALADAIEPRFRALVLLAGFMGLRRGELLGLQRRDVDLLHGTITVERQVVRTGKNREEGPPKTKAGVRTRPLPPFLVDELEQHLDEFTPAAADAPVFVGERGGPLASVTIQRAFSAARDHVGLAGVALHDLRHSAATMFAWTGATTREIMGHLGHVSPAAALRYQHAAQSRAEELTKKLDDLAQAARAEPRKAPTPIGRAKSATSGRARKRPSA